MISFRIPIMALSYPLLHSYYEMSFCISKTCVPLIPIVVQSLWGSLGKTIVILYYLFGLLRSTLFVEIILSYCRDKFHFQTSFIPFNIKGIATQSLIVCSSTTALIQKLSKENEDAAAVVRKAVVLEQREHHGKASSFIKRPHSTGDSSSSFGSRYVYGVIRKLF